MHKPMQKTEHGPAADIKMSFELFPPKTEQGLRNLDETVDRLAALNPEYFSVTYGAGGTTRDRTRGVVTRVAKRTGLPVAHHLTCVNASRAEVETQARELWAAGVRKLVALRGDPPDGGVFEPRPDGYPCAADLVEALMAIGDFDIRVACHPEVHPDAVSADSDLDNLKRKLDAGATRAITQYCFDTEQILRFVDKARARGIDKPIIPGIMPVFHVAKLKRFSETCGATMPDWLLEMFDGLDDDPATRAMVATAVATEQCSRLIDAGFDEFHVYALNRSELSVALARSLGIKDDAPAPSAVSAA
ncbi:MAG: methylenetetrahydrofolate reductase [NAD(P)H] [Hyphomicrobiales bacterium]